MSRVKVLLDKVSLRALLLFATAVVLLCGLVLIVSIRGSVEPIIRFDHTADPVLAGDAEIGGRITFDKDSYFLGEHATARVRILYREDMVSPDMEAFKRNIGFLPLDQLGVNERRSNIGNGVTEYTLDYYLHVIGIRKPGSYPMSSTVIPYSKKREPGSNVYTHRIARPDVHIGSMYPWNAGTIPLRDVRDPVLTQNSLRQQVMLGGVILLLIVSGLICWRFGRRRDMTELTEAERLWHEFRCLRPDSMDKRSFLLACERIFSRLLQLQTSMTPEMFWSGGVPDDASWNETVEAARVIFRHVYQSGVIADEDVIRMNSLLTDKLELAVEQQRLVIEQQPDFRARLGQQPEVAWSIGITLGLAMCMLIFAAMPDIWLAPEIRQYNETVANIHTGYDENLLQELQAFAGVAQINKIKAAAFYNTGTVRAANIFGDMPAGAQLQIRDMLFQAESADALLQTLLLSELAPSEEDLVSMLVAAAESLLQSELDLQTAARILQNDEDILRNLELVTRWRHAILTRLVQLRDLFSMKTTTDSDEDIISDQGLVNVIEAKLPEEYEDAEMAKDNSSYIIFERF